MRLSEETSLKPVLILNACDQNINRANLYENEERNGLNIFAIQIECPQMWVWPQVPLGGPPPLHPLAPWDPSPPLA